MNFVPAFCFFADKSTADPKLDRKYYFQSCEPVLKYIFKILEENTSLKWFFVSVSAGFL